MLCRSGESRHLQFSEKMREIPNYCLLDRDSGQEELGSGLKLGNPIVVIAMKKYFVTNFGRLVLGFVENEQSRGSPLPYCEQLPDRRH